MRIRAPYLLLALALGAAACGGSGGNTAATTASIARFCTSRCAWKSRCATASSTCATECQTQGAARLTKTRDSFVAGAATCFDSLACSASDDACASNYTFADPAFPNVPVVQSCLTKRQQCQNGFSDDLCNYLAALIDSARTQADTCRSQDCGQVSACLTTAEGI